MNSETVVSSLPFVILDGDSIPATEAAIRQDARLTRYGEGCFDTIRSYAGAFFRPDEHLSRLHKGMDYLGLEKVEQILDKNAFLQSLAVFLKANDAMTKHVRIRIQVWANDTTPGYLPGNRAAHVLFSGSIINKQTDDGKKPEVSLITSTFPRIPHEALPSDVKWSNGINYILAARQAQSRNADDALMMTSSGWVSETTIANIFWIRDEFVFTPSVACDLLPGIARNTILEILDEMGANANQGAYSCDFLKMADAVWVCNSVRGMRVVRQIDKTEFSGNHPFMEQIEQRFASNIKENLQYVR